MTVQETVLSVSAPALENNTNQLCGALRHGCRTNNVCGEILSIQIEADGA